VGDRRQKRFGWSAVRTITPLPSLRLAQAIHPLPEVKQPDKTGDGLGTLAEDGQATFGGQRLVELEEMMVLQRA